VTYFQILPFLYPRNG